MSSTFTPYKMDIVDISQAQEAVVTFATAHPFSLGEIVSLRVSKPYGMVEINNLMGRILSLDTDTITLDIDSSNFTPFVYPPVGEVIIPAQTIPSSSGIIPGYNPSTINLQDAFDNVPG